MKAQISDEERDFNPVVKRLIEYFGDADQKNTQKLVASKIGVSQQTLHAWLWNKHGIRPQNALAAQEATNGHVQAVDLCPELAALIDTP